MSYEHSILYYRAGLSVITTCLIFGGSRQVSGIVFRRESRESYSNNAVGDSWEKEIGRSSESLRSYNDRDYQQHFSEGGGILIDNSNFAHEADLDEETKKVKEEKIKWKGWNYLDTSKGGWTPHEKTVSFQFLDDDGRYAHAPPRWPHDEYMLQFGHPFVPQDFGLKNGSDAANVGISNALSETNNFESNRAHEWQKLRPYPSKGHFIGPGFYDGSTSSLAYNPPPPYNTHQAITDSTITTSSASASSSGVDSGDGQIPNAVSESATHGKLFPGAYGGSPYDYYRRKRLRLKLHPGLIAAPIAGFAAYKAVSAIASKPLLFELGWVGNKPNIDFGGGWGWPQQPRPPYPYYPNPYPSPVIHPIHIPPGHGGPIVPILRPKRVQQNPQKSAWWNPFAALTPRFQNKKDDRTFCCQDEKEPRTI
ncbi:uncharacterized protein LOC118435032 [Folsomia candida]|uniref:Uncharacterized protein n=1 Tax=Folsomia candida TaxID=158441 RepID=A0A226ENK8_FOLCA|nr:uncharacterized protein LOC118435032 [Folsomia candida]OXA58798.1 hypothetical protein Fcan01_07992 [Folsomia candida]